MSGDPGPGNGFGAAAFEPLADRLWRYLPLVYRERDRESGDLQRLIEAHGALLDRFRATLDQRLADSFADNPVDDGRAAQDWLLPYMAELLGAELSAPHASGRRAELSSAVGLAQRRGTRAAIERVVEAIAEADAVVVEGFRIVAKTATVGAVPIPAMALGETSEPPTAPPPLAAAHPGMEPGLVDLRRHQRAIRAEPANPAAVSVDFSGRRRVWPPDEDQTPRLRDATLFWRIANARGAPCFPGSYEDRAARLVDLRAGGRQAGRAHPARVVVHVPPPDGFFPPNATTRLWNGGQDLETGGLGVVAITDDVTLEANATHGFDHLRFDGTLTLAAGRLVLRRCAVRHLVIEPDDGGNAPVLDARDCFFETITAAAGTARLDSVTVLGDVEVLRLLASETIFAGDVAIGAGEVVIEAGADTGCLRYSRIPEALAGLPHDVLEPYRCTTDAPLFVERRWGERGAGVLSPRNPPSIAEAGEDGAEIGAYRAWRYLAERRAIERKVMGMLPIGQAALVVDDPRLGCAPPVAG